MSVLVKIRVAFALLVVAVASAAAAGLLASPASAWSIDNLPAPVKMIEHGVDATTSSACPEYYYLGVYDTAGKLTAVSEKLCTNSPTFQQDLDAFVNAYYTPPATSPTTTAAATTTAPTQTVTSTETVTTTTPAPAPAPGATTTAAASPPAASFTDTPVGLSVTFTDTSTDTSGTVAAVTWHYGDGANGTGPSASHVYTAAGTFTVVEIVTDSNGLASQASAEILVSPYGGRLVFSEHVSPQLSSAVSSAVGSQVAVFCVSSWGRVKPEQGYGLSIVGSRQANIWGRGCVALARKRGQVGVALLVLGHEVAHALGVVGERQADCYSLAHVRSLAKGLGIHRRGVYGVAARFVRHRWHAACV